MFLTKDDLKLSYGVDLSIGANYVERAVPADNLYWKNRTIYLPGAPGYIFIPIYTDILFRSGVPMDTLLSDAFIQTSESILHSAALHEYEEITWMQHVQQVIGLVEDRVTNRSFFDQLSSYTLQAFPTKLTSLPFGTPFPSLNRADSYLFLLSILPHEVVDIQKALKGWYALMTYFLLMDDLADIREDLKTGQANALLDAGLDDQGEKLILQMIDNSITEMNSINPVMANRIDHKKSLIDLHALIQSIRLGR